MKLKTVILLGLLTSSVAACSYVPSKKKADYWQRIDTNSAIYLHGPKAQQTLEEDIASCVSQVQELIRLNAVRATLPEGAERNPYKIPSSDSDSYWNVPQRYGHKYVDHKDFHDFDSCMKHKGWQRVAFSDYRTLEISIDTYDRLAKERSGKPDVMQSNKFTGQSGPYYGDLND